MKQITINDINIDEFLRQGKLKSLFGVIMWCVSVMIFNLWSFLVLLPIQIIQFILIYILDLLSLNTLHFDGSPAGVSVHLKILKNKVEDKPLKVTLEKE